ncbi:MAG: folylpolyglutamate synthase/dihydrofolate synthase family protein [Candidatus Woesearchaeota archaeon]
MQEILDYLYRLERFGIKLGLEETTKLLNLLENPQNKFKSIHIAGTNGKGSTSAFLASILQQAGYKVGLYTSPHLVKFNERIRINNQQISDRQLVQLTKQIKQITERNNLKPTFFEFTTSLAFKYFAEQKVDIAVIETGMGGRLDATNILNPLISVITNISFDHQKYLGDTLDKIAQEKAAIIKENSLVLTGENDLELLNIFKNEALTKNAEFFILNNNFKLVDSNLEEQEFSFYGETYQIKLLGEHQIKNASLALETIFLLNKKEKVKVTLEQIKSGLLNTTWAGRLQILQKEPLIILDGAHNVAGMQRLRNFVQKIPSKFNQKVLILGIAEDKEISEMCSLICPLFENIILTQGNYKPASLDVLEKEVKKYNQNIFKFKNSQEAINKAISLTKKDDFMLICGSIYLVGDVLGNFSD